MYYIRYVGRPAPTPEGFDLSVSPYVFLKGTVNTNYTVLCVYVLTIVYWFTQFLLLEVECEILSDVYRFPSLRS